MKGIIFNLLEQHIVEGHGDDVWDALLERAGVPGVYTAVGTYPDEELLGLVEAATSLLGAEYDDLVRGFGRFSLPVLAERYPAFFEGHTTARTFMLTLNDVIHPEVRKLFPGAYAPSFEFEEFPDGRLALSYLSHRNLCPFAEGLIEGTARHFGEAVRIDQPRCARRGDDRCVMVATFIERSP